MLQPRRGAAQRRWGPARRAPALQPHRPRLTLRRARRLNFSHGEFAWHAGIIDLVKEYNASGRGPVAVMLDTKGPEVRSGDLAEPVQLAPGDEWTFTTTMGVRGENRSVSVNYEARC
jgi:pyruvate kinase